MMEKIKVLWNVGSDEKPHLAWWGWEVLDIKLSDKDSLLKAAFRRRNISCSGSLVVYTSYVTVSYIAVLNTKICFDASSLSLLLNL